MKTLPALVCLLLISSVGCGQQDKNPAPVSSMPPAASVETPATAVTVPVTPNHPAAASGAAVAGEESGSVDEQTPVQIDNETAKDAVNTRLAAALAPSSPAPESRWKEGVNYKILTPAQPTDAPPGKVEVVEVFWYGCAHCYALEPYIENWAGKKAAYIQFTRLPVVWGAAHQAHARLFYTLTTLNRQDLHAAVFRETQVAGNMLATNDAAGSERLQLAFAKQHGIKEDDFRKAYHSFEVETKVQHATDLTRRYRVEGVPLVVINGKYTAEVGSAGGQGQLIELIGDLAAREHKKE